MVEKNTNLPMFLTKLSNGRQMELTSDGKVPIFKSQVGKVFLGQTISRQSVIFPY